MLGVYDLKLKPNSKACSALGVWRNVAICRQVCGDMYGKKVNKAKVELRCLVKLKFQRSCDPTRLPHF